MHDPERESTLVSQGHELATAALAALGLTDGLFHMEAFRTEDGRLNFGECAARVPGASLPEAIRAKHGVDLLEREALAAVGLEDCPIHKTADFAEVGMSLLQASPGRLLACPSARDIAELPGVIYCGEMPPVGSEMGDMRDNNVVNLSEVVVGATSITELGLLMSNVIEWAKESTVIVGRNATCRDLHALATVRNSLS